MTPIYENTMTIDEVIEVLERYRDMRRAKPEEDQDIRVITVDGGPKGRYGMDGIKAILNIKGVAMESFRDLRGSSPTVMLFCEKVER